VLENLRKGKIAPILKISKKEDLTLIHENMMEQPIFGDVPRPMKDKMVLRSSQLGFSKAKSRLTSFITFYNKMTADKGRAADIVYLDFNKTFETVSS